MCVFILIKRVITLLALGLSIRVTAHRSSSGCRKATGREGSLFRVAGCSRKASLSQRGKSLRSGPQAACSQAEAASSRSLSLRPLSAAAGRARGEVINSDASLRLDYRASSAKIMAVSSGHIDDAPGPSATTRLGPPAGCASMPR